MDIVGHLPLCLKHLLAEATPGPWHSMRDGNQYLNTKYMPTAKVVGASRLDGPKRPWNPHRLIAFGFTPEEYETARFTDADADLIATTINALPVLLDAIERLKQELEVARTVVDAARDFAEQGGRFEGRLDRLRDALAHETASRGNP